MKKLIMLLALLSWIPDIYSQILVEGFGYAPGDNIGGNTASSGTSNNNWTTHSNSKVGTIDVVLGSLTYTGIISAENKIFMPGDNTNIPRDVNRSFTTSTASIMYYSALINVVDNTQLSSTGDYFMNFGATSGAAVSIFGGRLGIKSVNSGSNFRLLIQNTSGGSPTFTEFPQDLDFETTYSVVVKYNRTTSPTTATLWVNPDLQNVETASTSVTNTSGTSSFSQFASICLRNAANTPKAYIDEIRVATSWTDIPLPVSLVYFHSSTAENNVTLNWVTEWEVNNHGFEVYCDEIKKGFVQGRGNEPGTYTFLDRNVGTGTHYYKLKQIDYNGNYEYYNLPTAVVIKAPKHFAVTTFPNPCNPTTTISYDLPEDTKVAIKIFDLLGQEVMTLLEEDQPAGYHNINFNGSDVASGIYLCRIQTTNNSVIKKITLIK